MRLPGEQLVLDTNVLVHLLRKKGPAGALIEQEYAVGTRRPRVLVPVVVKGEIKSLALQFGWGPELQVGLDALLAQLPTADKDFDHLRPAHLRVEYIDPEKLKKGII